jgi:hypothetical protein
MTDIGTALVIVATLADEFAKLEEQLGNQQDTINNTVTILEYWASINYCPSVIEFQEMAKNLRWHYKSA